MNPRLYGWLGLIGACLVGVAEFSMQFTPEGGLEDLETYSFFNDVSAARLSFGHYLAVISAPLYLCGYWFLSRQLKPASDKLSAALFLIGAYAFVVGTAWIGQRFFIATTVHEIANGRELSGLLHRFAAHNEPFVNILRVAILAISIIWIYLIMTGKTLLPKWMALFNPILLLGSIFGLYFAGTYVGLYLFPSAMNVTHIIIFSLTLWVTRAARKA